MDAVLNSPWTLLVLAPLVLIQVWMIFLYRRFIQGRGVSEPGLKILYLVLVVSFIIAGDQGLFWIGVLTALPFAKVHMKLFPMVYVSVMHR